MAANARGRHTITQYLSSILSRPLRRLLSAIVAAALLAATPAAAHHDSSVAPLQGIPPEKPARGLVYEELSLAPAGTPCAGGFEVEVAGPDPCTHGPDPAPAGVDVREPRSVAELRADAFAPAAKASAPALAASLVPCIGDGASGKRVQVLYVRPANRPDRFASLRSLIATWATQASSVFDDSAAQTGGSRTIRFVTSASPECELRIDNVTLSSAVDDSFANTVDELRDAGYDRTDRKYMVFMDANVLCGVGEIYGDDRPGQNNFNNGNGVPGQIGRTDAGCWGQLADRHSVEAHELIHNLGGVQLSAPNSSGGWHCVDEYDTECYSDEPYFPTMKLICSAAQERLLDCNDNDYFNTNPAPSSYLATHWNVADSAFLAAEGGGVPEPPNDAFASATQLSGSDAVRLGDSSSGATKEGGEPAHAGDAGGASIWYRWTAPASGPTTIDTAQSSFDTLLAVYTGASVGSLAEVASNDDVAPGSDLTSKVAFDAVAGQTYRIAVDGFGGASGTVRLQVTGSSSPPPNDAFAAAAELSGSNVVREADSNAKATKEGGEPAHAGNAGGASVWYAWTAPASGPVTLDTSGSEFDTLLAVYTGSAIGSLAEVASNDDAVPGSDVTSKVVFVASAGQTYRIAVDGFNGTGAPATGAVRLHLLATEPPPPNDAFAAATLLSGGEDSLAGDTNAKATKEGGEPDHAGNAGGASVWYAWTAPANGPVVVETTGSDFDTLLGAYVGGAVSTLSTVASNDDVSGLRTSRIDFLASAGTTYRIAVDGYDADAGPETGEIELSLRQGASGPFNDAFASPATLSGSEAVRSFDSNLGATKEDGEPAHAGNPGGGSVWYAWTAPATGPVAVETAGSAFDTLLAVYTGPALGALAAVGANDDVAGSLTSRVAFTATAGQTYRIAVDGYNGGGGAARGSLRIRVGEELVLPPIEIEPEPDPPLPGFGPRPRPSAPSAGRRAPRTRILSGPRGAVLSRRAVFRFGADVPATFACRLDGRAWSRCVSPKRYRGLAPGRHAFRVAARDKGGLVDPSPAVRRFKVLAGSRRAGTESLGGSR
jgi:hypothetical protein